MVTAILKILLFVVGIAFGLSLVHAALVIVAAVSTSFRRCSSCGECCFDDKGRCLSNLWSWFPLSKVVRRVSILNFLCPLCFERITVNREFASREVTKAYLLRLGIFILAVIPAYFVWLWAFTKISGR